MKCRTCWRRVRNLRQCDRCTRRDAEDLGIIACDEADGSDAGMWEMAPVRRRIPWALVAAVLAALATGAGYVATHQQAPQFVAVD